MATLNEYAVRVNFRAQFLIHARDATDAEGYAISDLESSGYDVIQYNAQGSPTLQRSAVGIDSNGVSQIDEYAILLNTQVRVTMHATTPAEAQDLSAIDVQNSVFTVTNNPSFQGQPELLRSAVGETIQ